MPTAKHRVPARRAHAGRDYTCRVHAYGVRDELGRGPVATADMKRRIAALRADGADLLDTLWRRHLDAVHGEGYRYEYAEPAHPSGRPQAPVREVAVAAQ